MAANNQVNSDNFAGEAFNSARTLSNSGNVIEAAGCERPCYIVSGNQCMCPGVNGSMETYTKID